MTGTTFNYPPHLPDFDDMDPDGAIEVLLGEDENGYLHTRFESVAYYRNTGKTHPWRHPTDWAPRSNYTEEDFTWALSRILNTVTCSRDLRSKGLGLTDDECRRIYSMRDRAREVAKHDG
jgi:hypothetical protein